MHTYPRPTREELLAEIARRLLVAVLASEITGEQAEEIDNLHALAVLAREALPADVVAQAERDAHTVATYMES
jgi:hypothetical protein